MGPWGSSVFSSSKLFRKNSKCWVGAWGVLVLGAEGFGSLVFSRVARCPRKLEMLWLGCTIEPTSQLSSVLDVNESIRCKLSVLFLGARSVCHNGPCGMLLHTITSWHAFVGFISRILLLMPTFLHVVLVAVASE